jgi:hypothetical protein
VGEMGFVENKLDSTKGAHKFILFYHTLYSFIVFATLLFAMVFSRKII